MAFRRRAGHAGAVARALLPAVAGLASSLWLWRRRRRKAVSPTAQPDDTREPIRRGYYRRRRLWD